MNKRKIPLILMLIAGLVTCIFTFVKGYSILGKLWALFLVFVIFFLIGQTFVFLLEVFERENEKKEKQELEANKVSLGSVGSSKGTTDDDFYGQSEAVEFKGSSSF